MFRKDILVIDIKNFEEKTIGRISLIQLGRKIIPWLYFMW